MPRLRVRFTVRRMMIAVALVAIGAWGVVLARRSDEYRGRASSAGYRELAVAELEKMIRQTAAAAGLEADRIDRDRGRDSVGEADFRRIYGRPRDSVVADLKEIAAKKTLERERYKRVREHCASLKEKYLRAARYPWLPVAPDPPEPE